MNTSSTGVRHTLYFLLLILTGLVADTAQALTAEWHYSYDSKGRVTASDGPRTDVADLTRFEYDDNGHLIRITNALGHQVQLAGHTLWGDPGVVIDPNGVRTDLTYNRRGWLTASTVNSRDGDITTTYEYDAVGLLIAVTPPDGNRIAYEYDGARRLTAVGNSLGERIEYRHDAMGNVVSETIYGNGGGIVYQQQSVYDELGRLIRAVGAGGQTRRLHYDANSNLDSDTDPRYNLTQHGFDALDRLVTLTDPLQQVTRLGYDSLDHLVSVTDPRGLETRYVYDGLGRVIQRISPDTGTTAYRYDEAGNLTRRTDGRGEVTEYSYDALNRLLSTHYPGDPSRDLGYRYDAAGSDSAGYNAGIGRLTGIDGIDGSRLRYRYDDRGNRLSDSQQQPPAGGTHTYTTGYAYDLSDRLTAIDYPDGIAVHYRRNGLGQVTQVDLEYSDRSGASQSQSIARDIAYQPFGPLNRLTWGNGLGLSRGFDQDIQLTQQQIPGLTSLDYGYDPAGNLTRLDDTGVPSLSQAFRYDNLDRLVEEQGGYGLKAYAYDPVGNRTERRTQAPDSDTEDRQSLIYADDSNRLILLDSTSLDYDGAGHLLNRDGLDFRYDVRGRLTEVSRSGIVIAQYRYNALGQRIGKTLPGREQIHYHYGPGGLLLGQSRYASDGTLQHRTDYIWLDGMPLAQIDTAPGSDPRILYLHPDHLNTPRLATDENQQIVWRWDSDAFGLGEANEDPDRDGSGTTVALRFPGQTYDSETGLHYNYFRDYDPVTGRYIESDPIGLNGGINTYSYVDNDPVNYMDAEGFSRRRANMVSPIQGFTNFKVNFLINQVRRYDPTFNYTTARPNSPLGRYNQTDINALRRHLNNSEIAGFCGPGAASGRFSSYSPNYIVTPGGSVYPVPNGAVGPRPVTNQFGNTTGSAFVGGTSGNNGQVTTMRIMGSSSFHVDLMLPGSTSIGLPMR